MIAVILVGIMAFRTHPDKTREEMIKEAEEIHRLMKQKDLDNGKVFSLVNQ